ncbi:heterogeneous nuclear ribonucleoprotein F isoform X2 [Tetranychus urticae]|uniref:heterogeneous nuclear ribonucleoprotein F isoform X2 n=1 Tax=Tetranychus urticae TaxID=32264 RepID=UPI00077B8E9B|nr:heterogeneous nuclear ribonucleoprotein F isoform X2 [Tetranychus urticae]
MSESPRDKILRLRGLPWQATREDVVSFFSDCRIKKGVNGVYMTLSALGRPSGEAYVEMESEEDVSKGLEKHKKNMGSRYIEVFTSTRKEMDWSLRKNGPTKTDIDPALDGYVRLRGLPFDCTKADIHEFFRGLSIARDGVVLPVDHQGRSSGEAYVQFTSRETADKAMGKHKEKIGHRYIEIFKSSPHEFLAIRNQQQGFMVDSRPSHSGRSGGSNKRFARRDSEPDSSYWDKYEPSRHMVHMRGLPYKATEEDIEKFFLPYVPIFIKILFDDLGRPSGEADVEFSTHEEASGAMSKDKSNMELRYIELFLRSRPSSSSDQSYQSNQGDSSDHSFTFAQRYSNSTHRPAPAHSYTPNNYSGFGSGSGSGYHSGHSGNYRMGSSNQMSMREFLSERTK